MAALGMVSGISKCNLSALADLAGLCELTQPNIAESYVVTHSERKARIEEAWSRLVTSNLHPIVPQVSVDDRRSPFNLEV